ncbi:MAG: hydantoinase/carbamoylase family amidase, partial [Natronospirillum sp.]
ILLPLAVLRALHHAGTALRTTVELVAFSDEEGTRFAATLVGSSAIAGCFPTEMLQVEDQQGISLENALRTLGAQPEQLPSVARNPDRISGFLEVHIEQGPVLEAENLPVGLVTAITGIERHKVQITGKAGHAGTTPMHLRQDALVAASYVVQAVNRLCQDTDNLVGVVGRLRVTPNAVNVIPSGVELSIELRSPVSAVRRRSRQQLLATLSELMAEQAMEWTHEVLYEQAEVTCAESVQAALAQAVEANGYRAHYLFSGAGHDGLAMAGLTDIGMLFVRCRDGLSHHPDEAVTEDDVDAAGRVLKTFLLQWPAT